MMNSDFDILFLGRLYPRELETEIVSKSHDNMEDAQNALQWNLIEGLDRINNTPVKIINIIPVGSYPKYYDDCYIKTRFFKHHPKAEDINVGYLNLCYAKHPLLKYYIFPYAKDWAARKTGKQKIIFLYTMDNDFLYCVKRLKRIDPSIHCCTVIADLPDYMNLSIRKRRVLSWYLKHVTKSIKRKVKYTDSFVLLTKLMKEYLMINKPFVVIEGISTDAFSGIVTKVDSTVLKTIVYTGTLHEKFGILLLLEAFSRIDKDNYRLIICGIGDSADKVKNMAKADKRIEYKGQLPHKEVLELQLQATILVNPRQNNEEFTKYSFPSKDMEYLSSGRPVVAYKLDGIPDEYDDYIQYVRDNSIDALSLKLVDVCEKSNEELEAIGRRGKEFVLREKNKFVQTERIMEMVEGLIKAGYRDRDN